MGDRTCIGTTDTRVDNVVAEPTTDDVEFLLANANALLALEKPLTRDDVIAQRCGVRPLVVKKDARVGNAEWTALSRKHEIDIHPERNMLSIYGGKLTDCINVGDEVAGIVQSFGIELFQSLEPWYGGTEDVRFPTDAETVIGHFTRAELQYIAEHEMVMRLADFLRRRSRLELTIGREALRNDPGLHEAARILFGDEAEAEIARYFSR
jgi:alpha-glycerophosphate oxidase/glycerol-3-phosphate dehydrogenase